MVYKGKIYFFKCSNFQQRRAKNAEYQKLTVMDTFLVCLPLIPLRDNWRIWVIKNEHPNINIIGTFLLCIIPLTLSDTTFEKQRYVFETPYWYTEFGHISKLNFIDFVRCLPTCSPTDIATDLPIVCKFKFVHNCHINFCCTQYASV